MRIIMITIRMIMKLERDQMSREMCVAFAASNLNNCMYVELRSNPINRAMSA